MPDQVPSHLESTVVMLKSAYPSGVLDSDVLPLMRALYDHMSDRALAKTMAVMLEEDYSALLNKVYEAAQLDETTEVVQAVVNRLKNHGYSDWCDDD